MGLFAANNRGGLQALFAAGETNDGRAAATSAMRLCPAAALNSSADAAALADWLSSAWDYLCGPVPTQVVGNIVLELFLGFSACCSGPCCLSAAYCLLILTLAGPCKSAAGGPAPGILLVTCCLRRARHYAGPWATTHTQAPTS